MPFSGDIQLDVKGRTVIDGGDLGVTMGDIEFIFRMLKYGPGSWKNKPYLGMGLDRYIGEANTPKLREQISNDIVVFFNQFGILLDVSILPVDETSIAVELVLFPTETSLIFLFDLISGLFQFDASDAVELEDEIQTILTTNKYFLRR
jgi:hypothetical protein